MNLRKTKLTLRLVGLILAILIPSAPVAFGTVFYAAASAGGGGGPASFSDDFSTDLSAFTQLAGAADISGGGFRLNTASFGAITYIHNTSTGSLTQYAIFSLSTSGGQYPWMVMRATDAASPYYAFQLDGNNAELTWYKFDNAADTSGSPIGSPIDLGGVFNGGHTLAISITGTAANTDVRVWREVTGVASAADTWNGDNTPDGTWLTTDPGADAVDDGQKVGLGGQQGAANSVTLDNFAGGGL